MRLRPPSLLAAVFSALVLVACGGVDVGDDAADHDHWREPVLTAEAALPPGPPGTPGWLLSCGSAGTKDAIVGPNIRCNGGETAAPQNEPAIAYNPASPGNFIIGANDFRGLPADAPVGAYVTHDGGATFTSGILPGLTLAHGGPYQEAADPAIACSKTGDCYYAAIAFDYDAPPSSVAVVHSKNGGVSWDPPSWVVADDDATVFHDKGWIAVDNSNGPRRGTVYVTWSRFEFAPNGVYLASPIYVASSSDLGKTWTPPKLVSIAANPSNQSSRPIVDRNGTLFVVYESFATGPSSPDQQLIQASTDGGKTFSAPVQVSAIIEPPSPLPGALYRLDSTPGAAADPVTGTLHVAWCDYRRGVADILVTSSIDKGKTWTPPRRANTDEPAYPVQNIFPAVACGPTGVCGVAFYSTRNDPHAFLLDVYYAQIAVSKVGISPVQTVVARNVRITDYSSDPGVQFGGTFFGDYIDLAIDAIPEAHVVWTDTRVRKPLNGAMIHQQDIFTARLPASPPPCPSLL
jgi:hypothetical protein